MYSQPYRMQIAAPDVQNKRKAARDTPEIGSGLPKAVEPVPLVRHDLNHAYLMAEIKAGPVAT